MNKNRQYWIEHAKIATYKLDIEALRELADFCNEMADSLEKEAEESVALERP